MKLFLGRLLLFCGLWSLIIAFESKNINVSILIFSTTLTLYFFLSLRKRQRLLLILISVSIFLHGCVLTDHYMYAVLLLLYVTIDATFFIKNEKQFIPYLGLNMLFIVCFCLLQKEIFIVAMIYSCFIVFLVINMNRIVITRDEQKEIYHELLGEYRQLKRMHVVAEREARLEERTRIARDIHDSVGHKLTALIMKSEMLAIQQKDPAFRDIKQMAEDSLAETRQAVKALNVDESEGIAAVVQLIRKLEAESHIIVQFTMKQGVLSIPLSNEKSVILYRVIQEALTNAMRHAQGREVKVILGKSANGHISFEISNPIFEQTPFRIGFGLTNMKERIDNINGTIHIYQTENQFIVQGTIPNG